MLKEFKEFALKGNVLDLAIAVIMGAAFNPIVNSLVQDIIMPPLGMLLGNINFSDFFINLSSEHYATLAEAKKAGAATINYGLFINTVLNFLITAFAIFVLVKQINRLKRQPAAATPNMRDCPRCTLPVAIKATRCPHCTSDLSASA